MILRKPDDIKVGGRLRHLDEARLADLVKSVRILGIKTPISTRLEDGRPKLVAGLHRLEAARRLGLLVPCIDSDGDAIDAELWEIAENLHRAELSSLDRSDHIARWIELTGERISAQSEPKTERGRPESGIRAAARELGIDRSDAQRAVKVASLSPDAKEAARATRLDDNRSALLQAAKAPAERQAAVIRGIAAEKAEKRVAERRPSAGPDFVLREHGDSTAPLEQRINDEQRQFLNVLRNLAAQHLAREFPAEDVGSALEIIMLVYTEVQNGGITGAKYRSAHPGEAA
jgi:ParB family chromosome partitioning protein